MPAAIRHLHQVNNSKSSACWRSFLGSRRWFSSSLSRWLWLDDDRKHSSLTILHCSSFPSCFIMIGKADILDLQLTWGSLDPRFNVTERWVLFLLPRMNRYCTELRWLWFTHWCNVGSVWMINSCNKNNKLQVIRMLRRKTMIKKIKCILEVYTNIHHK